MKRIGIIREEKVPPDSRVPLTPDQCRHLQEARDIPIIVQSSDNRCFTDDAYREAGIQVVADVSAADILLGVKEVPIDMLIDSRTYFMFSHTIKEQPYNRDLLRQVLAKDITLIDYEVLTDARGARLIAFGKFAGMVGAHNAIWTFGNRTGQLSLPRMYLCRDYREVREIYQQTEFPACKVVLTGTGRVAAGAAMVLDDMGFHKIDPDTFMHISTSRPVYTQLAVTDYARRKDGEPFTEKEFFDHPGQFESNFAQFATEADIMINGIFWDPKAPAFFRADDMRNPEFCIQVIADVTCDIAPVSSIPSTLRPTTIVNPVFGYDPETQSETAPYQAHTIDMMTIDNLPNELPRDASQAFGEQFIEQVLPELMKPGSEVIARATIAKNGKLGEHFGYLWAYAGIDQDA